MPLNITAAIVLKKIMQREKIAGTIKLWPGVAEELLGTKVYYVRDGYFKDTDVVIFTHIGGNWGVNWGDGTNNGLVSVEYTFKGESAHSAGAPWRGRSALDAAMLMDIGWNYRREHLRIQQRSHSVITFGGNQPNVVPPSASIWYYFRETDYPNIKRMWEMGDNMAKAAALMTDTTMTSRVLGSAWPQHMNKVVAETAYANIVKVGMPKWTRSRSDAREGRAERAWASKSEDCRPRCRSSTGASSFQTRRSAEADRMTSATCRGSCRRSRCAIRQTSRQARATTGPTRSRWRRRSRTKG